MILNQSEYKPQLFCLIRLSLISFYSCCILHYIYDCLIFNWVVKVKKFFSEQAYFLVLINFIEIILIIQAYQISLQSWWWWERYVGSLIYKRNSIFLRISYFGFLILSRSSIYLKITYSNYLILSSFSTFFRLSYSGCLILSRCSISSRISVI